MRRLLVLLLCVTAVGAGAAVAWVALNGPDAVQAVRTAPERAVERARGDTGVPMARCPQDAEEPCREVRGRVVLVESVDPDGDGDLHVVIADEGISLPGLTAVDVKPSLRPRRDPRFGDLATAAGPVQTGSYGQKQIHALRFAVQR